MAYWSSMVPSLNGNRATHFFKWLHVYQYIEHTVEYNCHFRAGGETGECFQLWFMFAVRYVNTAVIDGIVNGTMRSGEKFLPFHPQTLKGLTRHFSFLKLCFPDLIQLLKLVCFFFLFFKNKWCVLFFSLCYINFSITLCTGASSLHPRGGSGKP